MSSEASLSTLCEAETAEWFAEVPDQVPNVMHACSEPAGVFEVGLYYAAADLEALVADAPGHKRAALEAIVNLVRALAQK